MVVADGMVLEGNTNVRPEDELDKNVVAAFVMADANAAIFSANFSFPSSSIIPESSSPPVGGSILRVWNRERRGGSRLRPGYGGDGLARAHTRNL